METQGGTQAVRKARRVRSETVRVRVPREVKTWLERAARMGNVDMSDIVRPLIMQAFDARHKG